MPWEGWRGGRWCDRRLAVTACGCTLRLEFPFQLSGSPAHCWHCSLLAIPPLAPPGAPPPPPRPPPPPVPSMHEAASLQSNTPEGQMAESERIRCGATGSELAPCGAMHGWWGAAPAVADGQLAQCGYPPPLPHARRVIAGASFTRISRELKQWLWPLGLLLQARAARRGRQRGSKWRRRGGGTRAGRNTVWSEGQLQRSIGRKPAQPRALSPAGGASVACCVHTKTLSSDCACVEAYPRPHKHQFSWGQHSQVPLNRLQSLALKEKRVLHHTQSSPGS